MNVKIIDMKDISKEALKIFEEIGANATPTDTAECNVHLFKVSLLKDNFEYLLELNSFSEESMNEVKTIVCSLDNYRYLILESNK